MTSIDDREYWDRRDRRLTEGLATDAKLAREPEYVIRRLEIEYSATPDGDAARRAAIRQQINTLRDAIKQDELEQFLSKWTRDTTIQRRQEWNRRILKGQTPVQITRETGIYVAGLQRAIKYYGL